MQHLNMTTQELKNYISKVVGNNIRCLLPSYWWKRLFHQVADKIDEVEQKMDNLPKGVPIVSSENALNSLDVPIGSLASIANKKTMKFSECYVLTDEDSNLTDEELFAKLTPVTGIEMNFSLPDISTADTRIQLVAEGGAGLLSIFKGHCQVTFALVGETQKNWILSSQTKVDRLNEYLSQQRWYFFDDPEKVGAENMALFDQIFTIVDCSSDVYVKGLAWDKLAKEGENSGGGNLAPDADFTFVAAFDTSLNDTTTTSEKSANKTNASLYYQSILNGIKPKVALKFSFRDSSSSSESPVEVVPSFVGMVSMYNGKYQNSYGANAMVFAKLDIGDRFAGLTFDLIMDPDSGSILVPHIDASEINILHARVVDNAITSDGLSSLRLKQNQELYKYALSAPVAVYVSNTRQLIPARVSQGSGFLAVYAGDYVFEFYNDGTIVDHPIQKDEAATVEYVNEELAKKVDKVAGKQLSTEDFTTALKTKLEGLSNYDDTEISNAVARLRDDFDSLTQEDISAAIENFNEIISFLDGIEDSESLDSIIASIEQQIANKQDKIEDLETIRSGAALGATALQEHQDISHLATKEEVTNLQNEVIANEEVVAASLNDLNTRIEDIAENVGGATVTKEELAEAIEVVNTTITEKETATNEAIAGVSTSVETLRSDVVETYATKEELAVTDRSIVNLTNEILANEEVVASAFNDVNDRLNALSENVSGTTVTKEEFESTVTTLNESITTKADATATNEAITGLQTSVNGIGESLANYATTEALNTKITNITNEILTNEEITATALTNLDARIKEIIARLDALEG